MRDKPWTKPQLFFVSQITFVTAWLFASVAYSYFADGEVQKGVTSLIFCAFIAFIYVICVEDLFHE